MLARRVQGRLYAAAAMKHWLGMPSLLRNFVALLLVFISALAVSTAFHQRWIALFVPDNPYLMFQHWSWLSPHWLALTWGYDLLISTIAGIGLSPLLVRGAGKWWLISLGAAIGGLSFIAHLVYIAKHPHIDSKLELTQFLWINGSYFVPVCGVCIGGGIAKLFGRWL